MFMLFSFTELCCLGWLLSDCAAWQEWRLQIQRHRPFGSGILAPWASANKPWMLAKPLLMQALSHIGLMELRDQLAPLLTEDFGSGGAGLPDSL
jgi:hypothetical protein